MNHPNHCSQPSRSCGQPGYSRPVNSSSRALPSRSQLFDYINQVSFAVDDIQLYLDTHPCDHDALEYFRKYSGLRNEALMEYARRFGPLTVDTINLYESDQWAWIHQQWPWEGGCS